MHHSPVMRIVALASWLIAALGAINLGLRPFGFDVFDKAFMHSIATPAYYVVLVAGIISLIGFFMACTMGCCCCDKTHPHNHVSHKPH